MIIIEPFPTIFIVPTGIGCSIGGFAGDAIPAARLMAAASGCLITHPNVMNGASLYWPDNRILYVEGFSLDSFAAGCLYLRPVRSQNIGLLLDKGINKELKERHLQVADACRASLGLRIGPVVTTDVALNISFNSSESGTSWGLLDQPSALLNSAKKLKDAGATAIAVVTNFPELQNTQSLEHYRKGDGVDVLGGAEAVISHLIVKNLSLPCAHSPALSLLPIDYNLDPRAAAEELGYTFLSSVLVGLSKAPDIIYNKKNLNAKNVISIDDIGALVLPRSAIGGEVFLACIDSNISIIMVDNTSAINVTCENMGINISEFSGQPNKFIFASSYIEAAGYLSLLREGLSAESLQRPLSKIDRFT